MTYKIKICGLSSLAQIDMAVRSGADMAGFIFADPSPRKIDPSKAKELSFSDAAKDIDRVAVFVNPINDFLEEAIDSIDANFVQLHGDETVTRCLDIKALTGLPVIKSMGISNIMDIKNAQQYNSCVDYLLFDAKPSIDDKSQKGGLNKVFDWSKDGTPWMLAGGLNPDNLIEAAKLTGATQFDVSSGVETSSGVKDIKLISDFIQAANGEL